MDSIYTASLGKDRYKPQHFTGIRLKGVRVLDGGKITLQGYDAQHRLGIQFDNVVLDKPEAVKITAVHSEIKQGPGPSNIRVTGDDVRVLGTPGQGTPNAC